MKHSILALALFTVLPLSAQVTPIGTPRLPIGCTDTQIASYNSTTRRWVCTTASSGGTTTVPNGGTGVTSLTSNGVVIGNGTSAVTVTAEGATGTVLVGNTGADPSYSDAPLFGGARNLITTSTDGPVTQNTTAATVGVPVQISPRNRISGRGWDTDDALSRTVSFFMEVLSVSGATVRGDFQVGYINPVSLALEYPMSLSASGVLTITGAIAATNSSFSNHSQVGANSFFNWDSRSRIYSGPAGASVDGQINFVNAANSTGIGFDVLTDSVLKVRTRAQTGYAAVDALSYAASGDSGHTGAACTVFTGGVCTTGTEPDEFVKVIILPGLLLQGIDLRSIQSDIEVLKAQVKFLLLEIAILKGTRS